jgi:hypothetical protein
MDYIDNIIKDHLAKERKLTEYTLFNLGSDKFDMIEERPN